MYICFFFFFQAEDGIRDYKVTGVQTCALPISAQNDVDRLVTSGIQGHDLRRGLAGERVVESARHEDDAALEELLLQPARRGRHRVSRSAPLVSSVSPVATVSGESRHSTRRSRLRSTVSLNTSNRL